VAGEKLEDAIAVVKSLNAKGINATLDLLGEHTTTPDEAHKATQEIMRILDGIETSGVRSNVSIKLTQIGARIDRNLCLENLRTIMEYAQSKGNFVRIDMEDSPFTTETIEMYEEMNGCCHDTTGIVIQSCLYRSEEDVRGIVGHGGRIRLCKGAYLEPASVAFPKKPDVDANYDRLAAMMMDATKAHGAPELSDDGRVPPPPAFATHDPKRIEFAVNYAKSIGLNKKAIEFQMLNGIRRDLQEQMAAEGYPVRVYVPFGTEWYPYFTRRLAERPANVWFILSNYFRK
jgi:proline dehydrogenase